MVDLRNERGLTLIEVMMVVIILGILVALVVPRFAGRTQQARRAAAHADINANLAVALEMYMLDNGAYPTTEQGLEALASVPRTLPQPPAWNGPYIKSASSGKDPWGQRYTYLCPGEHNPSGYDLSSYGPDGQKGTPDDVNNWNEDETASLQ